MTWEMGKSNIYLSNKGSDADSPGPSLLPYHNYIDVDEKDPRPTGYVGMGVTNRTFSTVELLICEAMFFVAPIVCGILSVLYFGPYFVIQLLYLVSFLVFYIAEEERAGCFTLIVLLKSCVC